MVLCISTLLDDSNMPFRCVRRDMLRQVFNVYLNVRELAAIVKQFDKDNNKEVNCASFLLSFQKLGSEEKFRVQSERILKQRELDQSMKEEHEKKMSEMEAKAIASAGIVADFDFIDEENESAWKKCCDAAHSVSIRVCCNCHNVICYLFIHYCYGLYLDVLLS